MRSYNRPRGFMRVLLFHPWLVSKGGAERLILEYIKNTKYNVNIITWFYDSNKTYSEFKRFEDKIISIFPKFFNKILKQIFRGPYFSFIGNVIKILKDKIVENYNVILISTSGIAETILLRKKNTKIPVVLYVHTPLRDAYIYDIIFLTKNKFRRKSPLSIYYKFGRILYNVLEKKSWKNINLAIFNSKLSKKRALDKNLIEEHKTKVIYPGVNIDVIPGDYSNYFLYVSRYSLMKRQDVILLAWKKFIKRYPEYRLIISGGLEDRFYYNILNVIIKKMNINNVELVTNPSYVQLKNLHANALCEIQIPFMEDFGIVPLEAVYAEKPLIMTNSMGVYELIGHLPSIITVSESVNRHIMISRVYNAMVHFIQNMDYYIEKAKESKKIIRGIDLSWKRFSKELDETLEQIVYMK